MKTLLFTLFLILAAPNPDAYSSDRVLQNAVETENKAPEVLTELQLTRLQATQFIFIDGLFGDKLKQNFLPAQALINKDWQNSDVTIFRPVTTTAIPDNAEYLYQEIKKLRLAAPEKSAIIVAHSKGGAEALLMVLKHPDLVNELGVDTVDIVSAPIRGTNFDPIIAQCGKLNVACRDLSQKVPSLRDFLPEVIQPIFQTALSNLSPNDREILAAHLFYVRTQITFYDAASPLYVPSVFMEAQQYSGPNDGIIPTANEVLLAEDGSVFGTDLGVMKGDHNSLLNKSVTKRTLKYRQAFFQTLMKDTLLR